MWNDIQCGTIHNVAQYTIWHNTQFGTIHNVACIYECVDIWSAVSDHKRISLINMHGPSSLKKLTVTGFQPLLSAWPNYAKLLLEYTTCRYRDQVRLVFITGIFALSMPIA